MTPTPWTVPQSLAGFSRYQNRELLGTTQYVFRRAKLSLLITVDDFESFEPGAGVWAHASLARPDRDPTWREIKEVRDLVFGKESVVIQVLAPASHWLNVHEHCFHLQMRIDAPTIPKVLYAQEVGPSSPDGARAPFPLVTP